MDKTNKTFVVIWFWFCDDGKTTERRFTGKTRAEALRKWRDSDVGDIEFDDSYWIYS